MSRLLSWPSWLRHGALSCLCTVIMLLGATWPALATADDAGGVQAVPALSGRVIDQTGTLSEGQSVALSTKLADLETRLGTQMVVLMVPSTQPEDIASYAQRVGDAWKIGRRDVGDGLLLVVAKNDRRVRIEVAKTLEGAIPDLAAKQIIDRAITPAFKAGDYAGGLNQAIDHLTARVQGENLPLPNSGSKPQADTGFQWDDLGVFLFVGVPVVGSLLTSMMGRKAGSLTSGLVVGGLGWLVTTSTLIALGAGLASALVVAAMASGASRGRGGPFIGGGGFGGGGFGGGGFSGGGGGFSSGGGGDFGGGGASGDW